MLAEVLQSYFKLLLLSYLFAKASHMTEPEVSQQVRKHYLLFGTKLKITQ